MFLPLTTVRTQHLRKVGDGATPGGLHEAPRPWVHPSIQMVRAVAPASPARPQPRCYCSFATVSADTASAPASSRGRAEAARVAPVVATSSMRTHHAPATLHSAPRLTRNADATLAARS